jgi:hypothetical protein
MRAYADTPWVFDEPGMTAKTAIRRHAKMTPLGDEQADGHISLAADLDALADAGMIDMAEMADPEKARAVAGGEENLTVDRGDQDDGGGGGEPDEQGQQISSGEQQQHQQTETAATGEAKQQAEPTSDKPPAQADNKAAPRKQLF